MLSGVVYLGWVLGKKSKDTFSVAVNLCLFGDMRYV